MPVPDVRWLHRDRGKCLWTFSFCSNARSFDRPTAAKPGKKIKVPFFIRRKGTDAFRPALAAGGSLMAYKCKKLIFHSSRAEVALLRYIVFYYESGCDASEPHASTISRACSSLVRQPYYAPNSFILKISGLETIFVTKKGSLNGRIFYIDDYTLIFLFSRCIRCAQKRDCWESVRFASERSRVRIPLGPLLAAA